MVLSNGRSFAIRGIERSMFQKWTSAPSKGEFFHNYIRDMFNISRIK